MKIFLNENIFISGKDWEPNNEVEITDNLKTLLDCLNNFKFHTEAIIYFTSVGLSKLIKNFEFLDEYYSLSNPINRLRTMLLNIQAIDWVSIQKHKKDKSYYLQSDGATNPVYVNNTSIAEAAEYKFEGENVAVLNLIVSDYNESNPIYVIRRDVNPPNELKLIDLAKLVLESEVISYVVLYRRHRVYNWNPKHGENGRGMIPNKREVVSPLECNRQEAEQLLKEFAINSMNTNELYAYDEARDKFMVFKCDNREQNSYHSYHPIDQNEVPEDVKEFLLKNN